MEIKKIVITGGPCAGKSTAMNWIQNEFTKRGYSVLFIPETATELITGGVAPWTLNANVEYQKCQMKMQFTKEEVFYTAATKLKNANKVLIVCDRGSMDNKVYMTEKEFQIILDSYDTTERELLDEYDAVFHLVSAANGAEEFYTLENNSARTETVEQARELDEKLIRAWSGHNHLRVIDNAFNFKKKMRRLVAEIAVFLGESEPSKIERRYLIKYPDINWLENMEGCDKISSVHTYLSSNTDKEIKARQRGSDGNWVYSRTLKKPAPGLEHIDVEKRISKGEYTALLLEADKTKKSVTKTKYVFSYDNKFFELEVYPFWNDKAILKVELQNDSDVVSFPDEIDVIDEVTYNPEYKSKYFAENY